MNKDRFKFRVWDKYTHETPAEQMQFLCFNGCLVDSDGCHHSPDDYIIEQCTGLSDKNGNLIYENDQFYDSNKRLCTVSWHNGAFHNGFGNLLSNLRTEEIEIIGNIHEQKDKK